jgi:hypothetical protein
LSISTQWEVCSANRASRLGSTYFPRKVGDHSSLQEPAHSNSFARLQLRATTTLPALEVYIQAKMGNKAYQFHLKMGTERFPETLCFLSDLTQLTAREEFTAICRRESFKSHITKILVFWVITQRRLAKHRHIRTTYQSHLQG